MSDDVLPKIVRIGVGVALFEPRGNLLLMERRADNGLWGFIGGELNFGESILDCARREVREETGLNIGSHLELIGVYSNPKDVTVTYPERVVQKIDVFVRAYYIGGQVQSSPESIELKYFAIWAGDKLHESLVDPNAWKPYCDLLNQKRGVVS